MKRPHLVHFLSIMNDEYLSINASITMKEHVVYHRITDMLRDSSYSDVITQVGDQSGRAIAEAMDTQAFAEFANFTGAGDTAIALASFTVNNNEKQAQDMPVTL